MSMFYEQILIFQLSLIISCLGAKEELNKNGTTVWFPNQTGEFTKTNPYCSICCMNITQRTVGKQCGFHTMCVYSDDSVGPVCKGFILIEFDEQEKFALLHAHNTIRNTVALGKETRGNPGPQLKASNMRILEWSRELELIAQRWIKQCFFAHDLCRDIAHFPVGQNIAKGNFATTSDLYYIQNWYSLVEYYDSNDVHMYTSFPKELHSLKQYTQLVWADTYLLGCARAAFQQGLGPNIKFREHFFCNYGPTGNIPGLPVYRVGLPCSECPEGTGCTVEYPALCGNELVYEIDYEKYRKNVTNSVVSKVHFMLQKQFLFTCFLLNILNKC